MPSISSREAVSIFASGFVSLRNSSSGWRRHEKYAPLSRPCRPWGLLKTVAPFSHLGARKRERVRCSSLVDWPVYPRLRGTMQGVNAARNSGRRQRLLMAWSAMGGCARFARISGARKSRSGLALAGHHRLLWAFRPPKFATGLLAVAQLHNLLRPKGFYVR